jgi:hypothetical protein
VEAVLALWEEAYLAEPLAVMAVAALYHLIQVEQ